jgi:hypothetical protein
VAIVDIMDVADEDLVSIGIGLWIVLLGGLAGGAGLIAGLRNGGAAET